MSLITNLISVIAKMGVADVSGNCHVLNKKYINFQRTRLYQNPYFCYGLHVPATLVLYCSRSSLPTEQVRGLE